MITQIGLGDIRVFKVLESFDDYGINVDQDKYPELNKLKKRLSSELKTYLDARVKTAF